MADGMGGIFFTTFLSKTIMNTYPVIELLQSISFCVLEMPWPLQYMLETNLPRIVC